MKKEVSGLKLVFGYFGLFLMFIGVLTAVPMFFMLYPGETECWFNFVLPVACDLLLGAILYFSLLFKRKPSRFLLHQDSLLLLLIWVAAILSNAAPMFIADLRGQMEMNFSESIFEATSAFSTTGVNVFKDFLDSDLTFCPHVYCFARAWMQFLGGMGFVLILASLLGGTSMALYQSEGHTDRILASLGKTAKVIFGIYSIYTVLGSFALWFSGMPLFDAITTSMCALSGGGLSCRSTNIAFYRSYEGQLLNYHLSSSGAIISEAGNGATFPVCFLAIEIVMMVLVVLSAISFVLHTFFLSGKWRKFFRDEEILFFFLSNLLGFGAALLGAYLALSSANSLSSFGSSTMDILFYVIGSSTNSGFSTTDIATFNSFGRPLFFVSLLLMCIGGGMGSTAGGIKEYRFLVQMKAIFYNLRYRFLSHHQLMPKTIYRHGKMEELDAKTEREAFHYSFCFLSLILLSTLVLLFLPSGSQSSHASIDFSTVLYNVTSAASNTGYGLNDFLAYRAEMMGQQGCYHVYLWVLTLDMLLGRLEILPAFYGGASIPKSLAKKKDETARESTVAF